MLYWLSSGLEELFLEFRLIDTLQSACSTLSVEWSLSCDRPTSLTPASNTVYEYCINAEPNYDYL